jgi:hypothetical protein
MKKLWKIGFIVLAFIFIGAGTAGYFTSMKFVGSLKGVNTNLVATPFDLQNKDGTSFFKVDSLGTVTGSSYFAGIDSFLTTAAKDTIQIKGVTATSVFVITPKTFDYSTAVDTAIYSYMLKTDTLIVSRVKSYTGNGATAVKSGAHYGYVRIKK